MPQVHRRGEPQESHDRSTTLATGTTQLRIPVRGRPLPERVTLTGTRSRTIAWSGYDASVHIVPPAPDLVVEMPYDVQRPPAITAPAPVALSTDSGPGLPSAR